MPAAVDLHCHTAGSLDSTAEAAAIMAAAVARGLTHLAITDHDTIEAALRARDAAPAGLTVIVGEECLTSDGDLICIFLERPIAPGRPAVETAREVLEAGGLVGVPHPFDRSRRSVSAQVLSELASLASWIEVFNGRVVGRANEPAARFAAESGLAGVAVSDAHSVLEVGVAYSVLTGSADTADELRAALAGSIELVPTDEQGRGAADDGWLAGLRGRVRRGLRSQS